MKESLLDRIRARKRRGPKRYPHPFETGSASNMTGTKEVRELLAAVRAAHTALEQVLADGNRPTTGQLLGLFITLNGPILAALDNVKQVGAELADLTEQEFLSELGPDVLRTIYPFYRAWLSATSAIKTAA